jgi:hypothetical protein
MQNPACFVNPEWTKESPAEQGTRVVSKLYQNKTDHHDITEILLKVALNTKTLPLTPLIVIPR